MDKHPIIANGEIYAEPVTKALGGGQKTMLVIILRQKKNHYCLKSINPRY
jgi:hypothetical protein